MAKRNHYKRASDLRSKHYAIFEKIVEELYSIIEDRKITKLKLNDTETLKIVDGVIELHDSTIKEYTCVGEMTTEELLDLMDDILWASDHPEENNDDDKIVKKITFDVLRNGVMHKDLVWCYDETDNITKGEIYSEDGPWGAIDVGDEVIDFQFWADPDEPNKLLVQCCLMVKADEINGEDYYTHTEFLYEGEDIKVSNIRVDYV